MNWFHFLINTSESRNCIFVSPDFFPDKRLPILLKTHEILLIIVVKLKLLLDVKVLHPLIEVSLHLFCQCYKGIIIFLCWQTRRVMAQYCRGTGKTAVDIAVNHLIVTDDLHSIHWNCWTNWSFFSWERRRVIFNNSTSITRNCIT